MPPCYFGRILIFLPLNIWGFRFNKGTLWAKHLSPAPLSNKAYLQNVNGCQVEWFNFSLRFTLCHHSCRPSSDLVADGAEMMCLSDIFRLWIPKGIKLMRLFQISHAAEAVSFQMGFVYHFVSLNHLLKPAFSCTCNLKLWHLLAHFTDNLFPLCNKHVFSFIPLLLADSSVVYLSPLLIWWLSVLRFPSRPLCSLVSQCHCWFK